MIEYGNNKFFWKRTTTQGMGRVEAEIEIINGTDVERANEHIIGEDEIRRITVNSLVDTGATYLCINENIQQVLQLPRKGKKRMVLADEQPVDCDLVGPVEIRFKNRTVHCTSAVVLPGSAETLLGLIPLEEMDVVIDPKRNELIVNPDHPDYAVHRL